MNNQVIEAIFERRSHRAYSDTQLTQEQLDTLLEAALASPSANNLQPWHFSVVQNRALLDSINSATREGAMALDENLRSPRFMDAGFDVFYQAPTVIFISSPPGEGKALDCGIAVMSIAMAAQGLGLGSVILGLPRLAFAGDQKQNFERALGFPEGYSFTIAIALGHPTDSKPAHERDHRKIHIIR
ncbi:MAG: nitroreductase family protein [Christensenellales bacterium]|jgi:nitroreductase